MRYWDSSSLVPLIVDESGSSLRRQQLIEDEEVVTWWGSRVECASALNRLARDGALGAENFAVALRRLEALANGWAEVQPQEQVRRRAMRLLSVHSLRAADAFQLAAALIASREEPGTVPMVCGDGRLSKAAQSEGFEVL